jgi:hypothetical protein
MKLANKKAAKNEKADPFIPSNGCRSFCFIYIAEEWLKECYNF